jgi:hypothetical protein
MYYMFGNVSSFIYILAHTVNFSGVSLFIYILAHIVNFSGYTLMMGPLFPCEGTHQLFMGPLLPLGLWTVHFNDVDGKNAPMPTAS